MMSKAKSIVNKKLEDFEKLKGLLETNMGYIGKFTEYLFCENVPYDSLVNLYCDLKELKLKSVNLDINKYSHEKLIDKIIKAKEELIINSFRNKLPSLQKSFVDNDFNSVLILKAIQKDNLDIFLTKVSRYKTYMDFANALQIFCNADKNDNDIEILKENIKNLKSEIIYDKDNYVVVHVDNYEEIKILGSDTSWCIVNDKHQWNVYTRNSKQFILYDYNLDTYNSDFKIGFTCRNDSLYAAHDILDRDRINYMRKLISSAIKMTYEDFCTINTIDESAPKVGDTIIQKQYGFGEIVLIDSPYIQVKFDEKTILNFNRNNNNLESLIIYNKKITRRTPIKDWEKIIPYLPPKDAEEYLNKLLEWDNKSYHATYSLVRSLIERIIISREYVSEKYVLNLSDDITHLFNITSIPKVYDHKSLPSSWTFSVKSFNRAFSDGFWTDSVIRKTANFNFLRGIISEYRDREYRDRDTTEHQTLINIYEKLYSLYNDTDKFNVEYIGVMMIMGRYLGVELPESIEKDFNLHLMSPQLNDMFRSYREIVKLPIDLNKDSVQYDDIELIMRKDYDVVQMSPYFGRKGYTFGSKRATKEVLLYECIINRLSGHKVTFEISREQLKFFRREIGYFMNEENLSTYATVIRESIIFNMLYKLSDKKRVKVGDSISDETGNVKIVVK